MDSELEPWGVRCHHGVKQCALRARSTHDVHHAIVGVNVVIGLLVAYCELHVVVRVHVPLVVCDEAVVRRTLGLIALVVIVVFVEAILKEFCCIGSILFTGFRKLVCETKRRGIGTPVGILKKRSSLWVCHIINSAKRP